MYDKYLYIESERETVTEVGRGGEKTRSRQSWALPLSSRYTLEHGVCFPARLYYISLTGP